MRRVDILKTPSYEGNSLASRIGWQLLKINKIKDIILEIH